MKKKSISYWEAHAIFFEKYINEWSSLIPKERQKLYRKFERLYKKHSKK